MQNSQTTAKPQGLSSGQNSTETGDNKNYPLLTRDKIGNTQFYCVGNEDIGYKITWGRFALNEEPIKNKEEAMDYIEVHKWDVIMNLVAIGFKIANENSIPITHEHERLK